MLSGLAANALMRGDAVEAVALAQQSAAVGIRLDNHRVQREANVTQALAMLETGNDTGALSAAGAAARFSGTPSAMSALGTYGLALYRNGEASQARVVLVAALDLNAEGSVHEGIYVGDNNLELPPIWWSF